MNPRMCGPVQDFGPGKPELLADSGESKSALNLLDLLDSKPGKSLLSTLSRELTNDQSERGPHEAPPRSVLREQCEFSESTLPFLNRYSKSYSVMRQADGSQTFYVPLHGITSRSIAGDESDEPKYFRSVMEVTVPPNAHNLDQCHFKRGPRVEVDKAKFLTALNEEIKGSAKLAASEDPLSFFTHGVFTSAGKSDVDAVRLALLSGVPTVNIDWRSTPGPWYSAAARYAVDHRGAVEQEKSFEPVLDNTLAQIGENNVAMISFSRGTAFNAGYMKHRFENRQTLPQVNANVLTHPDLFTSEFKTRENGQNPIAAAGKHTFVLGNPHDRALMFGGWQIFGDRVGDAEKSDVEAVTAAGGKYVIDNKQPLSSYTFNHYVDYSTIANMIKTVNRASKGR